MVSARQAVAAILRATGTQLARGSRTPKLSSSAAMLCVLTASLSWSAHTLAQETPAAASDAANQPLQEVTVTGSRIKRTTDYTTSTPTTVTDAATMDNLGVVNVGSMLQMTPSNVSEFTPQTTGGSSFYTGAYIPDLRGINGFFSGARTLTLIDGERVVPTNTQDSFDLNFIPQVLVQRIDTVTGGASAAYGSGAESGVLNVILDKQLEGGKLNADTADTDYNDAKDRHVSAAYGHGLFDNRLHFVVAGEFDRQDNALCDGRAWCEADRGPYTTGYNGAVFGSALTAMGTGLTSNLINSTGVLAVPYFSLENFGYGNTLPSPVYAVTADGLDLVPYTPNGAPLGGALGSAPGGSGLPANYYTNLSSAVTRSVLSAMLTGKLTDSINSTLDLNWGKVQGFNPGSTFLTGNLGYDNPYLQAATSNPSGAALIAAAQSQPGFPPGSPGIAFARDATAQIPESQYNNTTVKRISLGLDGKVGQTSWSWDAHLGYGKTQQVQGSPSEITVDEASMAEDAVTGPNGQPECRITANGGNFATALASAEAATGYNNTSSALPAYLQSYQTYLANPGAGAPLNPVSGLNGLQTLQALAAACQPLNPLGSGALQPGNAAYASGALSLLLNVSQKDFTVNTTGEIWKGTGAGAWSLAAGYEWRSELLHNDFTSCPDGLANTTAAQQLCLARTIDFSYQFGNAYAGSVSVNEGYLELNAPLLKDLPFVHRLELDIAGRESSYSTHEEYAVGITPGATSTASLPTWKASMLYEPIDGLRFRASQSHDSRAPTPRDLYYSQTFAAGGFFGSCNNPNNTAAASQPCYINLSGNPDLKPEVSNTTTLGLVFTPPQLRGLQASADWFHIRLTDGINGGSYGTTIPGCALGEAGSAYYCSLIEFNPYYYNASGQACTQGAPVNAPGSTVVNCTGLPTATGLAAFQRSAGGATNILEVNNPAYNGAFYDERGVDFSVSYVAALPGGSTLTARALATWVGEQQYANVSGGAVTNLLGQTGNNSSLFGLGDYQTAGRWAGNLLITWSLGGFSLSPNMRFVGEGTLNNYGLEYNPANPSTNVTWLLCSYAATKPGCPAVTAAETAASKVGYVLLPANVANHVPSYFLFGLNAAYNFDKIPGIKGLQVYTQVNNLLNKAPPFTGGTTSNPVYFDELGLDYRVGFRMTF